ncbi:MAG: hypothetical protein Q8Q09_27070 [Deltaproteobacteria bacterium]|nr:hypothetical protein [Deltaproteobacteria bacterium]
MARKILMGLLALGVVGGYSSGFHQLKHRRAQHQAMQEATRNDMARRCATAALEATAQAPALRVRPVTQ